MPVPVVLFGESRHETKNQSPQAPAQCMCFFGTGTHSVLAVSMVATMRAPRCLSLDLLSAPRRCFPPQHSTTARPSGASSCRHRAAFSSHSDLYGSTYEWFLRRSNVGEIRDSRMSTHKFSQHIAPPVPVPAGSAACTYRGAASAAAAPQRPATFRPRWGRSARDPGRRSGRQAGPDTPPATAGASARVQRPRQRAAASRLASGCLQDASAGVKV